MLIEQIDPSTMQPLTGYVTRLLAERDAEIAALKSALAAIVKADDDYGPAIGGKLMTDARAALGKQVQS